MADVLYRCGHVYPLGETAPPARCPVDRAPKVAIRCPRPLIAMIHEPTKAPLRLEAAS